MGQSILFDNAFYQSSTLHRTLLLLLQGLPHNIYGSAEHVRISGITTDSRRVRPGFLFVALRGEHVDGHAYVHDAVVRGCAAFIVEQGLFTLKDGAPAVGVEVADTREALALVAAAFYGHPARDLRFVGITGTNGKTTTTYLIEALLVAAGYSPGVIGTINYRYKGLEVAAPYTTPDPIELHRTLRLMLDAGVTHVVMEVSSHALAQKRVYGLLFDVAVFTNLTRDHLDYHGDMEEYFSSKKRLFAEYLHDNGKAVIMWDGLDCGAVGPEAEQTPSWADRLIAETANPLRCGMDSRCDIYPMRFSSDLHGIDTVVRTPRGVVSLRSPLVGEFNMHNLLVAIGVGVALRVDFADMVRGLEGVRQVPGRLERVVSRKGTKIFVDYAHTPDALANILTTLRRLGSARLICVFGCGGARDRGKRALMGMLAGQLCDVVLVTSDNPRSEMPESIMRDIEFGLLDSPLQRRRAELLLRNRAWQGYDLVTSRREAIALAIKGAASDDVVVIAGKGHEDYQIVGTQKKFFDDRQEVRAAEFRF